jgi:hypothetical protein
VGVLERSVVLRTEERERERKRERDRETERDRVSEWEKGDIRKLKSEAKKKQWSTLEEGLWPKEEEERMRMKEGEGEKRKREKKKGRERERERRGAPGPCWDGGPLLGAESGERGERAERETWGKTKMDLVKRVITHFGLLTECHKPGSPTPPWWHVSMCVEEKGRKGE